MRSSALRLENCPEHRVFESVFLRLGFAKAGMFSPTFALDT